MKMKMSMNESMRAQRIGIIGARGHTGQELICMIARHPGLELAFVSSRKLAGERVADHHDSYRGDVVFEALTPQDMRSEEHTSELQSRGHLVCRLLLEKKKKRR